MQIETTTIDGGNVQLSVRLNREELAEYVRNVEHDALSEIQIDGFRKGKAPKDLGRQQLDQNKILQAALEDALERSLAQAIAEKKLDVFRVSDLKISENSAEQLAYSVSLALFPEATLPDLSEFSVQRKEVSADDKEVEDTIEVIRNARATFTTKDTPAQTGDRVEVDFNVQLDGKTIEGGDSKNHPLIIGGKNFIPGFEDNLIGMQKMEEKKFSLVAPDDYYQKNIAGKKLDFTVTVKNIQSVHTPELTDTFAQGLGKFQTLEQLKSGVKEGLIEEKKQKEQQRVRLELLDAVIAKMNLVLPEAFVHEQLDHMLAGFQRDLGERGMDMSMYLTHLGKTVDDLKKEWQKEAERQAKIAFVIHLVARDYNLAPTETEITESLNQMAQALIARGQATPEQVNLVEMRRMLTNQMTNEKALEYLERTCVT